MIASIGLDQAMATVIGAFTGGVLGSIVGPLVTWWLGRKSRHYDALRDAYSEWARSFEHVISHSLNYYQLLQLSQSSTNRPDLKAQYENEIIRVSQVCGDAGRRLDSDHLRVLLLEKQRDVRGKVTELTNESFAKDLPSDPNTLHGEYSKRAAKWRDDLQAFMRELADNGHFGS